MKTFKVQTLNRKHKIVKADYVRIEAGHLIFKNEVSRSYPTVVMIFAAGFWRNVEATNE